MDKVLTDAIRTARKEYLCDASYWIENEDIERLIELTAEEIEALAKARKEKHMIHKGERYVYQSGIQDGDMVTFRAKEPLHKICLKYGLYGDG